MDFFLLLAWVATLIMWLTTRGRVASLESELRQLRKAVSAIQLRLSSAPRREEPTPEPERMATDEGGGSLPTADASQPAASLHELPAVADTVPPIVARVQEEKRPAPPASELAPSAVETPRARPPATPAVWPSRVKKWLFEGNLVAKAGLLILIIGVGFLLKFATSHVSFPIELRLATVTLADVGLLIWGWRIRVRRPTIALPVQGAALSILMLVVFGTFRVYQLMPPGLAFALLFAITAFTCILAVAQNGLWLALFGIAGGFSAPILISTGQGSHIALFSYYALLNAGVLAIALMRSWRVLNIVGFAFTFVVGTAWGVTRYTPEHYLSAQLFLIAFVAFYIAISLMYGLREAPRLKHYVDATLVFGTPLVGFGLQYGLTKETPFAPAYSALALGLFYCLLATLLWNRRGTALRLLVESFLALAVIFGTLAIPLALDGRWTSAAWALEGAGVAWVGLRQRRPLTWGFGILVQFGSWISFIGAMAGLPPETVVRDNLWLGFVLLAASSYFVAIRLRRHSDDVTADFSRHIPILAATFLAIATIWTISGAWIEILARSRSPLAITLTALSGCAVVLLLSVVARRLAWNIAHVFAVCALIATSLFYLQLWGDTGWPNEVPGDGLWQSPFLGALLISLAAGHTSLQAYRFGTSTFGAVGAAMLGWAAFWWFGLVLRSLAVWLEQNTSAEFWEIYALLLAASNTLTPALATRLSWPQLRWTTITTWAGLAVASLSLLGTLYLDHQFPPTATLLAYFALWLSSEWLMRCWATRSWPIHAAWLKTLHGMRCIAPWLMIWPAGRLLIDDWIGIGAPVHEEGGYVSASWSRFLPTWLMMTALAAIIRRARQSKWPAETLSGWYATTVIPFGCAWMLLLVTAWNLTQDGKMAPLPYLPLLNPLDITTALAILLTISAWRHACEVQDDSRFQWPHVNLNPLFVGASCVYAWLNLVLIRSAANFAGLPYRFDELLGSSFIQALLSLAWTLTALVLMRIGASRFGHKAWMSGAVLLAVVVAKLFFIDLSHIGGVWRIVSFVGVGLLMVAIGYLAPLPEAAIPSQSSKEAENTPAAETMK